MPRGHWDRHAARLKRDVDPGHRDAAHEDTASQEFSEQVAQAHSMPVRLTTDYGFYDAEGTYLHWFTGQIETDPSTIALLQDHLAPVEFVEGDLSGLHPTAHPKLRVEPAPANAPLHLVAPFEFYDANGTRHCWVAGELVDDPAIAAMLRHSGARFNDVVPPAPVEKAAPFDSPLQLTGPFAYYDNSGVLHFWMSGELVDNPETAALLRQRGAPFVDAE